MDPDAATFARELADFVQSANGGLILTASALSAVHQLCWRSFVLRGRTLCGSWMGVARR